MTVYASLHSLLDYECLPFHCDWLGSDLRICHVFYCDCLERRLSYEWIFLSLSLILRPTVRRPGCLGIKHPSGAYDQIFITVRVLWVCWYGTLSLTRGRVCSLQLLLVLGSVIFGSESRGTRDHILLCQIRDFPFRHLVRLAGLRWRSWIPPPHRTTLSFLSGPLLSLLGGWDRNHS
jgi:hypothetical protein